MGLMQELANQPAPLSYWLNWMALMNLFVPLIFLRRIEPRVVIASFLLGVVFMTVLYDQMGYGKHLGLAHVVIWTPLVLWLLTRLDAIRARGGVFPFYVFALIATDTISLVIDYADVITAFRLLGA